MKGFKCGRCNSFIKGGHDEQVYCIECMKFLLSKWKHDIRIIERILREMGVEK